jgi:lipid II:glycine glycyltransferase (peptidoglycan interpeptide bridge formation enzyme)
MPEHDRDLYFPNLDKQPIRAIHSKRNVLVQESCQNEDSDWDSFVAHNFGGDILQTSLWSQVKADSGWSPVRLIVRHADEIIGGVQLLSKRVIPGFKVGAVLHGPLNATNDPYITELLMAQLQQLCKQRFIQFLLLQPSYFDPTESGEIELPNAFHRSVFDFMVPQATTVIDLHPDPDDLLKHMRSKTRYNIRLGIRKGVNVREGSRSELGVFHSLLLHTAERQGFVPQHVSYFENMWDILTDKGYMKIFFAELNGEPLSVLLVTMFGDTVVYKRGGWSGHHGDCHPNEVLHWEVMNRVKSAGYRYYDFDGIDPGVAIAIVNGKPLPQEGVSSVTRFKLGFGGRIMMLPKLYEYVKNPALRWGSVQLLPRLSRLPLMEKLLLGINRA